ncbi:MAG: asparagine synthetase B, partial [Deltaproteobacteria bacterium]|nr:asparagine synthetase B [Deltaproteobacteria bacterium]
VYARAIARQYGTDHTEFVVEPDALAVLDKIVWHFDEPFADASAIPTYYVSQMARQKVTVALSGDGGDESLAGYIERYYLNCAEDRIRKKIPSLVRRSLLGSVARVYPKADCLPRPLRLKNFLTNLSLSFEQAYYRDMSFYFTPEMKKRLYKPWLAAAVAKFDAFEFLGKHFRANNNSDVTSRVQYADIKTYLPEDILVKVDRMSMAHSLEIRSPLLDHTLLEFLGRLPSSVKLRGRTSKYIFKRAMEDRLPHDILYRKKQGFSIPLASWLRGSLQKPARESLFPANGIVNDYFETKYLDRLWKQHQAKVRDVAYPLWGLIMLQRWWETYARQK